MYLLIIQALLVQVLLIHSILYYLYTLYQMTIMLYTMILRAKILTKLRFEFFLLWVLLDGLLIKIIFFIQKLK